MPAWSSEHAHGLIWYLGRSSRLALRHTRSRYDTVSAQEVPIGVTAFNDHLMIASMTLHLRCIGIILQVIRKTLNCTLPVEIVYNGEYEMDSKTCHRFEVRVLKMVRSTLMVPPGMCHPRQSFHKVGILDADV